MPNPDIPVALFVLVILTGILTTLMVEWIFITMAQNDEQRETMRKVMIATSIVEIFVFVTGIWYEIIFGLLR